MCECGVGVRPVPPLWPRWTPLLRHGCGELLCPPVLSRQRQPGHKTKGLCGALGGSHRLQRLWLANQEKRGRGRGREA